MTDVNHSSLSDPKAGGPSIRTFQGSTSVDQIRLANTTLPPDCNGAAGYNHFVELVNGVFSIYDKQTGTLVAPRVSDTQFWRSAGISRPGIVIDPRIVFIPDAGRYGQWLAVQLDFGNRVLIATTNPLDPDPRLDNWQARAFDLPGNDFTMLGYDAKGIYIGDNNSPGLNYPRLPQIVFIPRSHALAYPPQVGPDDIKVTKYGDLRREVYGDSLYPVIDQSGAGWPYETLIGVDNLSQRHLTFALFSPQFGEILSSGKIEVEPFQPVPISYTVAQPDSAAYHKVNWGGNLVAAPMSDGFNIWLAQTVINRKYGQLAVRWYRLALDTQTRMPGLAAWGEIFQPFYDSFNPSILSFGKDDYTIVSLSRSGFGNKVPIDPGNPLCGNLGAYAAIFREADSEPQLFTLKSGQVPNFFPPPPPGNQRWGDYATICRDPDPKAQRRAWVVNQYALKGGQSTSQWANIIAAIDLPLP